MRKKYLFPQTQRLQGCDWFIRHEVDLTHGHEELSHGLVKQMTAPPRYDLELEIAKLEVLKAHV